MFEILTDEELLDHDFASLVIVEPSQQWPDQLVWLNADQQGFIQTYRDWVSRHSQLNELFALPSLKEQLEKDGYVVALSESTRPVLANFERWNAPLKIEGLTLRDYEGTPSDLWDYQRFTINRALERIAAQYRHDRFFYFGWGAGTGKSAACAAGALEALNRDDVELVLAFTMRKLKLNLRDFFTNATPLNVAVCDGDKKRRRKLWADRDIQVYVNNYDKAHWDYDEILARIADRRVLFIFDEVEVLLTAEAEHKRTRVRKAMDELMSRCRSTTWPMSASIVDFSPFTYRDNYSLGITTESAHPLGTREDFEKRYCTDKSSRSFKNPHGRGWYTVTDYEWDHVALQEVRHRVSHATQNARQTDPGVRENFPGIQTIVVPIQLSEEDRRLYDTVKRWAQEAYARGESPAQHVELMRYICNHPGALGLTAHPLGAQLAADHPNLVTGAHSSKLEVFCDQVEQLAAAGEKVVAFTKWTSMCLHLVSDELRRRRIRFVDHHGGMSDAGAYAAQQAFKTDPTITLFWSSDVGTHGLNFQMARYIINYECPRSWRKLNQRMNRINRADGKLSGRVSYIYVTYGTCEERIWATNNDRRMLAEATTGAREEHSWVNDDIETDENKPDSFGHTEIEEILFS
jgi:hypothetical protein